MNMIVCDQQCRHQKEGYCGLNHIAQLTSAVSAKCGYFEDRHGGPHSKMNLPGAETPGYQADDTGPRPKKGLYGTAASSGVSNLFGS